MRAKEEQLVEKLLTCHVNECRAGADDCTEGDVCTGATRRAIAAECTELDGRVIVGLNVDDLTGADGFADGSGLAPTPCSIFLAEDAETKWK